MMTCDHCGIAVRHACHLGNRKMCPPFISQQRSCRYPQTVRWRSDKSQQASLQPCSASQEKSEARTLNAQWLHGTAWTKLAAALAVFQIAVLPIPGPSFAELDTTTQPAGVGAAVEGSDISNEDQKTVLAKLKDKILPETKDILGKVGRGEGSNYPSSIAQELETVELEVNDLIEQANKGGDMSNIKSAASGIEQQVNALKAIVGFD